MNIASAVNSNSRLTKKNAPDRLGFLAAQAKVLDAQMKEIKDFLKNCGEGEYEGEFFKATVNTYEQERISKKLAEAVLSPKKLAEITETIEITAVTARAYSVATAA
jgi:16S rRNA C1402 N4-methylase RsmH